MRRNSLALAGPQKAAYHSFNRLGHENSRAGPFRHLGVASGRLIREPRCKPSRRLTKRSILAPLCLKNCRYPKDTAQKALPPIAAIRKERVLLPGYLRTRRVTTGHNRDDGRSYFSGFLLRQQRIGTRGHLTCSRRYPDWSQAPCGVGRTALCSPRGRTCDLG